ncbi:MAG: peptidylprolyl isomerase [Bacteroidaceae bacterium]|nr:peptidylprolyl isomerase [Bacteroidaceae bacterium]
MKKPFIALAVMAWGCTVWAQKPAEDAVVMTVAGKDVTRTEFEYSFNKNNNEQTVDKKALDEYVQLFVDFKLKVAEAEAQKLDTMTSFINEYNGYRHQQAEEYLVDTAWIEAEARRTYNNTAAQIGPQGLVLTSHILLMVPQNADEATQQRAMVRMDSIYNALQGGADFAELAMKYSEDPGSARQGGRLDWFFAKQILKEYADVAYSLQIGELSKPFFSPAGVHVVKLLDKKQFEPYEYHRENIHKFLEQRGVRKKAVEVRLDSLHKQYGGKVAREEVMAYAEKELEKRYPEFRLLMQEYHDGLLLFEVSNREVWEKAAQDQKGLEKYFKKNKKKYAWDSPRFKGAVVHCATPELAARVKKEMKKMPEGQWRNYIQKELNQDSLKLAYMQVGLFKQGTNAFVDSLVFEQGAAKPMENYPHAVVVGKLQKKYPASYKDVRGPLTADYQKELEKRWIEGLRAKFPVTIHWEEIEKIKNK